MLIKVMYNNGTYGMVKPYLLDKLLADREVTKFKRSDGWVFAGHDSIRCSKTSQCYDGPERRKTLTPHTLGTREMMARSISDISWICGIFFLLSIMLARLQ